MRRKHPTTIIAHNFRNRQFYDAVAGDAEEYWRELLPKLGDEGVEILIAAHGKAVARAARLQDKINTFKSIIASAHDIIGIGDEDALAILAGWSTHNVVREEE